MFAIDEVPCASSTVSPSSSPIHSFEPLRAWSLTWSGDVGLADYLGRCSASFVLCQFNDVSSSDTSLAEFLNVIHGDESYGDTTMMSSSMTSTRTLMHGGLVVTFTLARFIYAYVDFTYPTI